MKLKKNRKVFTSKSVGTGPSSYEKRIYRAAVSQKLRNTALNRHYSTVSESNLTVYISQSQKAVLQTAAIPTENRTLSKTIKI